MQRSILKYIYHHACNNNNNNNTLCANNTVENDCKQTIRFSEFHRDSLSLAAYLICILMGMNLRVGRKDVKLRWLLKEGVWEKVIGIFGTLLWGWKSVD